MFKKSKGDRLTYGIVGIRRFGYALAMELGAEVVYPERDMAIRLANRLETTRSLDFVQLSEKINISKIQMPKSHVGYTVLELNLRGEFGLNIIAIENEGTVMEMIQPEYRFRKNDILYLAGSKEGLRKFCEWATM